MARAEMIRPMKGVLAKHAAMALAAAGLILCAPSRRARGAESSKALDDVLISAVKKGDAAQVRKLIGRGANVGVRALDFAIIFHHPDIVSLLIKSGADVNARYRLRISPPRGSGLSLSPLEVDASYGEVDIAKMLLDHGAKLGSALADAAVHGRAAMALFLLDRGANPDSKDGLTALDWAAANGHANIVKILLARGAHVDPMTFKVAAANGHPDIIELLKKASKKARGGGSY